MLNIEFFKDDILRLSKEWGTIIAIDSDTHSPVNCYSIDCDGCELNNKTKDCAYYLFKWFLKEYDAHPLSIEDKETLTHLFNSIRWDDMMYIERTANALVIRDNFCSTSIPLNFDILQCIETGTSQNLKGLFIKAGLLTKGENEC